MKLNPNGSSIEMISNKYHDSLTFLNLDRCIDYKSAFKSMTRCPKLIDLSLKACSGINVDDLITFNKILSIA